MAWQHIERQRGSGVKRNFYETQVTLVLVSAPCPRFNAFLWDSTVQSGIAGASCQYSRASAALLTSVPSITLTGQDRIRGSPQYRKASDCSKLRCNHNRGTPKCCPLCVWVQHRHLAIVLSGVKLAQINAEAERHRFQSIIQPFRYLHRLRFECFRVRLVEAHVRD